MNAWGPIVAVFVSFAAYAPAADRLSSLHGRVLDPSGAAIPDAGVTVVNQENGFRRVTGSQSDGAFAVASLAPGTYNITVRKDGFGAMIRLNVELRPGAIARTDFVLPIGAVEQTVIVEGDAPLLSAAATATGIRVVHSEIERLPLGGRGVLALIDLAPGTNVVPATRGEAGQFTLDGQRPNANYFTVDGVSANLGVSAGGSPAQVTGVSLPAVTAFGSLDSLLPLGAVDEFRVTGGHAARDTAGRAGAIVSLTSRSGSNQFHGSAQYGFRHEAAAANDWFANVSGLGRAPLRMHDFAPALGGPIRRNSTFFFAAYERMSLRGPYVWQQAVPSLELRSAVVEWMRPALDLFPLPNGSDLEPGTAEWSGRNIRPSSLHSGALRLDQAITPRITLFGRYNQAPSSNEFGSTQVNRLDLEFRSLTLGLNARPSARTVMDLRVNESQAEGESRWIASGVNAYSACPLYSVIARYLPASPDCNTLVRLLIGGVGQGSSGSEGVRRQRQFELAGSGGWNTARLALRFGADLRRITAVRRDASGALTLIASGVSDILTPQNLWIGRSSPMSAAMPAEEVSAWASLTWQAGSRLTISPALRWQYDPPPVPDAAVYFYDPASGKAKDLRGPLWRRTRGGLAPRVGLAWRVGSEGATTLRASAGLSYDSSLSIATDAINSGPLGVTEFLSSAHAPFSASLGYGFMPDLEPARVVQWNLAADHAFSRGSVASLAYVGSTGRRLVRRELGGAGNTTTTKMAFTTNHGASHYEALQAQYRRRVSNGLDALVSYAWSHSIDDVSSDSFLVWAGTGVTPRGDRASSDYDLRHSFSAALSYELPRVQGRAGRVLNGWAIDAIVRARSGFPITVLTEDQYLGVSLANAFRPNLALSQPIWLEDPSAPGGRRLNRAAFLAAEEGRQGILGRNAISGFGMSQADLALRREFRLGERARLHLRLETFNALNQANFADPVKFLSSPVFGRSTSMLNLMLSTGSPASGLAPLLQTGAARSVQATARFSF